MKGRDHSHLIHAHRSVPPARAGDVFWQVFRLIAQTVRRAFPAVSIRVGQWHFAARLANYGSGRCWGLSQM
ncbi:hypothetical protein GCM10007853_20840 [Algimonas ampicilliniresistens]|uniref:Uncharacterized protein n=1 Tax=Algimonas ampicilliniresistens TaxID=1298735 RepID=A0ABQ5V9U0_9PROT|nr:hypothetical protein GCM10007853_20840 [Algimonas ampicilliniresistens]